jgi:hypothetical protein
MAKVPEQTHDGNLNRSEIEGKPSAGARRPAGKSDNCDEALGNPGRFVGEEVKTLPVEGEAGVCTKIAQENMDGNPKKRTDNVWGGPTVKGSGDFQQK